MFRDYDENSKDNLIIILNKNREKIVEIENSILQMNDVVLVVEKPDNWTENNGELIIPCNGPTGPAQVRINQRGEKIL